MRKLFLVGLLGFVLTGWLAGCRSKPTAVTALPALSASDPTAAPLQPESPTPTTEFKVLVPGISPGEVLPAADTPTPASAAQPLPSATSPLTPSGGSVTPALAPDQATTTPGSSETPPPVVASTQADATATRQPEPVSTPIPVPSPVIDWAVPGISPRNLSSDSELSLLVEGGGRWARLDVFHWNEIEPFQQDPPVYYWGSVDETGLIKASAAGQQVVAIVLFAPRWAQKLPGVLCGPVSQEAFSAYGRFLNAVVSRYSQPPYNIKFWELGNEPDVDSSMVAWNSGFGCWGDHTQADYGGGYYADMLKAVYPQMKAADPDAQVLVGGLLLDCDPDNPPENPAGSGNYKDCSSARFIQGILQNGGGDYFDGISFHAYDYYFSLLGKYGNKGWHSSYNTTGPVLTAKVNYLRDLLAAYGHPEKYLMSTEVAILCGSTGGEAPCLTDDFNRTKANYVAQVNAVAQAEGLWSNIWYALRAGWRATDLIRGNWVPLPAYHAYQASVARLAKAVFTSEVTDFPQVKGYAFTRQGTRVWLLWSLDIQPHEIQLPSPPSAIYNVLGESLPAEQTLMITQDPVYIEWSP